MERQVFLPGQQQASGLFLGWWEASCCLLSRFFSVQRCGPPGADTAAPRQETAGALDSSPEAGDHPHPGDPSSPRPLSPRHPHLGPSITQAISTQDLPLSQTLRHPSPLLRSCSYG